MNRASHIQRFPWFVLAMAIFIMFWTAPAGAQTFDPHDVMSAVPPRIIPAVPVQAQPNAITLRRPPRIGPNVQVNAPQQAFPNGLLGRSETTVASTSDGQLIVVGFNDAQGFCGPPFGAQCTPENPPGLSGFAFSNNGGLSFTDGGAPPALGTDVFTRGDPWLDRDGNVSPTFFYANLAVDATSGAPLGVSVHRGSFDANGNFAFQDVNTFNSSNPNDAYDKEALAVAKDGSGAAYVTVTNFKEVCGVPGGGFGEITVWRTQDGGNTWQGPVVAGPDLTTCDAGGNGVAGGILQQSSVPAIGPNGELYVAWSQGPTFSQNGVSTDAKIVVAASFDGGQTFGPPVPVANINSMRRDTQVGYNRNRMNDHPRITVATSGSSAGRVFAVFYSPAAPVGPEPFPVPCPANLPNNAVCEGQNLVSSQIFISHSDDQGATWSTPAAIASAEPATGVKRFWPVVNVESGGNVDVVYYESQETTTNSNPECEIRLGSINGNPFFRAGPANSLVNTFWAQSLDGSTFKAPLQVSSATSNWCTTASNIAPNFGDYIGAAAGGNHVFATWADGRNGVPDTFYAAGQGIGKQ